MFQAYGSLVALGEKHGPESDAAKAVENLQSMARVFLRNSGANEPAEHPLFLTFNLNKIMIYPPINYTDPSSGKMNRIIKKMLGELWQFLMCQCHKFFSCAIIVARKYTGGAARYRHQPGFCQP